MDGKFRSKVTVEREKEKSSATGLMDKKLPSEKQTSFKTTCTI